MLPSSNDPHISGESRQHAIRLVPGFSDHEILEDDLEADSGDYSTRMEELFDDGGDEQLFGEAEEIDREEDFIYTGVDVTDVPMGYKDQLQDLLGSELTDEDEEIEIQEIEKSLTTRESEENLQLLGGEPPRDNIFPYAGSMTPQQTNPSSINGTPLKLTRPFLQPIVSRLRSYAPQASDLSSDNSIPPPSQLDGETLLSPSYFFAKSRMSSDLKDTSLGYPSHLEWDAFMWTELRTIAEHIFDPLSQKLTSVLGTPSLGTPTVLTANGLICIGTDKGKICVYDFKQHLKCVCSSNSIAGTVGAVTALALSHDHTYVASGHATGYIQLFDLKDPNSPVRTVPPTTLAAVASGRKEGHIRGSHIVSIDFVAGRHTAIVSADDHGLAFSHSLGKVLFVEASDILRILGKYQREDVVLTDRTGMPTGNDPTPLPDAFSLRRRRTKHTILDMAPLPLGTSPHVTDQYNLVALLTPTKLVVIGLKPTPRTWFKWTREIDEGSPRRPKHKLKGTLAWYPSILINKVNIENQRLGPNSIMNTLPISPLLVYTWSNALYLIRVTESRTKQLSKNPRTGKISEVEVGRVVYENISRWSAEDDILVVQWLNANQIIIVTVMTLQVYDIHDSKVVERVEFDTLSLVSPTLDSITNGINSAGDVRHSLRVYKGKVFLLGRNNIRVGTLLTWADRILSLVHRGDFLSAIDLTRSYYVGDAPGNRNGLPDAPTLRKEIIGGKMRDLMAASVKYAFSEDRMTDGTHVTPDGRGVDRTSLFEGLVTVCCRACIALGDFEFIFEDLFQQYDEMGISKIYLRQLEPLILDNEIRYVPPYITQRLIALHEEDGQSDRVESIIWHMDPGCLDINQVIRLCQQFCLYDALIYIYTRALRDCVAPVVELLGLIKKVQQYRGSASRVIDVYGSVPDTDVVMQSTILNAYKIYPYLSNILCGLSYPSEEPLAYDEASQAKKDVYTFIFSGRSCVWPPGEGAKLVLTSDEADGAEPTYPYVRQLLRFDSESFLHSLDIAFEDSYLNDESQGVSRLIIVRILLEILSSGELVSNDVTFINIFIARNVPKYPQFLTITPSTLHSILVGLAEDLDPDTREDRQLAAEYLLSVYSPHESERIIQIFQTAGFYRILRSWYRRERRWVPLLSTYFDDHHLHDSEIFRSVDDTLAVSARASKGLLPQELIDTVSRILPRLLSINVSSTAALIDKHAPSLHESAIQNLGEDNRQCLLYLQCLLGQPREADYENGVPSLHAKLPVKLSNRLHQLYVSLQCQYHPGEVIEALKYLPVDGIDWEQVIQTCKTCEVYHAVIWATNWRGRPREALAKAEAYQKLLTLKIVKTFTDGPTLTQQHVTKIRQSVESLEHIGHAGIAICLQYSQSNSETEISLEDIWFQLLSSQINCVQILSGSRTEGTVTNSISSERKNETNDIQSDALNSLRALVQTTFTSLVSITSTHVSFSRLFKRLADSTPATTSTQYNEFRIIITGMLESYRTDGDMLLITKHLVQRDLFQIVAEVARERERGWSSSSTTCKYCRKSIFSDAYCHFHQSGFTNVPPAGIVIPYAGAAYHDGCLPQSLNSVTIGS